MSRTLYASYPGFDQEEIRPDRPTGAARLTWVVVVDDQLSPGGAVKAAVCVAAATSAMVTGLLGADAVDADGSAHPGLPWIGTTILTAATDQLARLRARAAESEGVFVADMAAAAQETRVYDEYVAEMARSGADTRYMAVGVVGPRDRVAELVHGLPTLS